MCTVLQAAACRFSEDVLHGILHRGHEYLLVSTALLYRVKELRIRGNEDLVVSNKEVGGYDRGNQYLVVSNTLLYRVKEFGDTSGVTNSLLYRIKGVGGRGNQYIFVSNTLPCCPYLLYRIKGLGIGGHEYLVVSNKGVSFRILQGRPFGV